VQALIRCFAFAMAGIANVETEHEVAQPAPQNRFCRWMCPETQSAK